MKSMKSSKVATTGSVIAGGSNNLDDALDGASTENIILEASHDVGDASDADVAVEGFRGPQVCKLIGISYRQLDYWARTGLLTPSVVQASGSGSQRIYSYSDLLELKVLKRLLDSGVSLRSARKAVDCLRDEVGGEVGSSTLVFAGGQSILAHSNDEVIDLLRNGQGVFSMVALQGIVDELEADITTLPGRFSSSDSSASDGNSDNTNLNHAI